MDYNEVTIQNYRMKLFEFLHQCDKIIQIRTTKTIYNGGRLKPVICYLHPQEYSIIDVNKFFPLAKFSCFFADIALFKDLEKKQPFIFFDISQKQVIENKADKIRRIKNKYSKLRIFEIDTFAIDNLIEQKKNNKEIYQIIIDREITKNLFR